MEFKQVNLNQCNEASGVVVVIDVLRAFTTSAYAFSAGVNKITLVSEVKDAFNLKDQYPQALIMGEVDGIKVDGFDYGNSPAPFVDGDFTGGHFIHRTSSGTQGVIACKQAELLLTSSFTNAKATARFIKKHNPKTVTFVVTGSRSSDLGDEDRACADYLETLLHGEDPEVSSYKQRVWNSEAGKKFLSNTPHFPKSDLEYALNFNCFDFVMVVDLEENLYQMRAVK